MSARSALRGVEADLRGVDVERGDELDVADVVAAEHDVHEAGHAVGRDRRPCSRSRPCTSELAQLPMPAMARRILLMWVAPGDGGLAGAVGGARALSVDEPVEPGEVVGEVLGVALEERTEVGVVAAAAGAALAAAQVVAAAEQLGAAALEQLEARGVGQVAAKATCRAKARSSLRRGR